MLCCFAVGWHVELNIEACSGQVLGFGYLNNTRFEGATFVHQVGSQLIGALGQKTNFVVAEVHRNGVVIVAVAWLPAQLKGGTFVNVVVHILKVVVAQSNQRTGKNAGLAVARCAKASGSEAKCSPTDVLNKCGRFHPCSVLSFCWRCVLAAPL